MIANLCYKGTIIIKNWGIGIQVDTYFIRTESRPEHIGQFVDDLIFRKSIQGTGGATMVMSLLWE